MALGRAAYDEDIVLNQYNDVLSKTKMHIMSDSIIIAAPVGYPEALAVVIDICDVIQEQLYDLEVPVFLRGAIAEGDFYLDEQLILARAWWMLMWRRKIMQYIRELLFLTLWLKGKRYLLIQNGKVTKRQRWIFLYKYA